MPTEHGCFAERILIALGGSAGQQPIWVEEVFQLESQRVNNRASDQVARHSGPTPSEPAGSQFRPPDRRCAERIAPGIAQPYRH